MAEHKNDQENDDLENIDDKDDFLKGGFDAGSDLDELTFSDSEFVDLASDAPDPIDEILGAPLEELAPLDDPGLAQDLPSEDPPGDFIPIPAARPSDESFLTDELPDPSDETAPTLEPPHLSPLLHQELEVDTDLPQDSQVPAAPEPSEASQPPHGEPAGNQRLDPSLRRPRPRPRPRQRSAPAEDDIIFDDEDDFTPTIPDEVPPAAEIPAASPPPTARPQPDFDLEPEPSDEPLPQSGVTPAVPDLPPAGLGEFDEQFDDLPDMPVLDPPPIAAADPVIDPTPMPDLDAIARMPDPPLELPDPVAPLTLPDPPLPPPLNQGSPPADFSTLSDEDSDIADLGPMDEPAPVRAAARGGSLLAIGKKLPGKLKPLELASLTVIALSCIAGAFLFQSWLQSGLPPRDIAAKPAEEAPASLRGAFVQVGQLEAYWRPKNDSDPSTTESDFIPEIQLTLDGDSAGYLLAIFRNAEGKLVSSMAQRIDGGKFASSGTNSATLSAESGLENEFVLATYRTDDRWRWQVTLRESSDNQDWSDLANFYFPADSR